MVYSKTKKILFILFCLLVLLFPFWCIRGFCADNVISGEYISGLNAYDYQNYFGNGGGLTIYQCKKGYNYTITVESNQYTRSTVYCSERPALNVTYTYLYEIVPGESTTYSFHADNDCYLSINGNVTSSFVVTENKPGMNDSVSQLTDTVGINNIWGIFDISINYIVIVVLVAFGIYIIFRIIRKISRGKEGL